MIIKKIKINNDSVEIVLDEGKIIISLETYLNGEFLVGNEIDNTKLEEIKDEDYANKVKLELLNKISKKRLSKKECREFLFDHLLNQKYVDKILEEYQKNYLINDLELAESILSQCIFNKKGIEVFKEKLADRGITLDYQDFINKYLDCERYTNNIKYLIEKYKKLGKNKSPIMLKQYLKNKMIENGYSIEEFVMYLDVEDVNQEGIISSEIIKFFKNREINAENIDKITKKLLSKGFNYDIIKKSIRECELNETN